MALLITKTLTAKGLSFNSFYVRLSAMNKKEGDSIYYRAYWYPSKEIYQASADNQLEMDEIGARINIPVHDQVNYDRDVDGNDTLDFVHNEYIKLLKDLGDSEVAIFSDEDFSKDI